MKRNIIYTIIGISLIIICIALRSYWDGFNYFALSFLILTCLYWIAVIVYNYIDEYRTNILEGFKYYCAKLINSEAGLTSQYIEENKEIYIKKYKQSLRKEKLIEIAKILLLLSFIIVAIIGMATRGKF